MFCFDWVWRRKRRGSVTTRKPHQYLCVYVYERTLKQWNKGSERCQFYFLLSPPHLCFSFDGKRDVTPSISEVTRFACLCRSFCTTCPHHFHMSQLVHGRALRAEKHSWSRRGAFDSVDSFSVPTNPFSARTREGVGKTTLGSRASKQGGINATQTEGQWEVIDLAVLPQCNPWVSRYSSFFSARFVCTLRLEPFWVVKDSRLRVQLKLHCSSRVVEIRDCGFNAEFHEPGHLDHGVVAVFSNTDVSPSEYSASSFHVDHCLLEVQARRFPGHKPHHVHGSS